jgi:hypothetical protein
MGAAGAAILLAPALFPQLRQLTETSGVEGAGLDFGPDFDLGSLDSVDSAFDAIDSSVDAGSGDGGASDGGSDGGGSDSGSSGD